jgi:hypothetical protein
MDEILIKSLEVLEDGKILTINDKNNTVIYLQPVIVVDSKDDTQRLEVKGSDGNQVRISTDINTIDGVSFSGTFEQLETAIREAAKKANGLLNGGVSGGGGGGNVVVTNNTDPSTATKQDDQISIATDIEDNTKKKTVGTKVELTNDILGNWNGFPVESFSLTLSINGDDTVYPMNDVESLNNEELVQQLNNVQNVLSFDWVEGSTDIVFNGITVSNPEVTGILIQDNNSGALGYSTFTASTDQATGAVQQLVNLMQQLLQVQKSAPIAPEPSRLVNPSNVILEGFKYLVFSCDGANNSITVTQNGNSVTYPQANLDGSLLRGYELPLSKVPYTNSITFNGTGTVDILKID